MGVPAIKYEKYTYEDYLGWDDQQRWELINGFPYLMSPAPNRSHQSIVGNLYYLFRQFLNGKPCTAYIAPFDIRLSEKNEEANLASNVVQPDISVFCDQSKLDDKGAVGAPDVIIEVLSPSTFKKDTQEKFLLYERFAVKEYWIADPDNEFISVYLLNAEGKFDAPQKYLASEKIPVTLFAGFQIDLCEVFEK